MFLDRTGQIISSSRETDSATDLSLVQSPEHLLLLPVILGADALVPDVPHIARHNSRHGGQSGHRGGELCTGQQTRPVSEEVTDMDYILTILQTTLHTPLTLH